VGAQLRDDWGDGRGRLYAVRPKGLGDSVLRAAAQAVGADDEGARPGVTGPAGALR
jgi:hypothetical protein